ncbi:MFS transporter [Haliscomenobacter sp.]|uniref:MFS transporter n=1 Tax=Haliscomenobacter sp. TaxID=2717303 RepID=UPI00359456FE
MAQTQPKDAYEVLKIADYRNYLFSRIAVTLGVNVLGPTVGWQIYELTQEPFALGLIGLAEFLPFLLVTLIGGYIADIFDRRKIMVTCISLYALCAFSLYLITHQFPQVLNEYGATPIYLIIGLTGLVRGFMSPAQTAFAAQLVPPQLYANAATWNTMTWQLSSIGGPAIGGILCATSKSAWPSYGLAALLAIAGLGFILLVPSKHAPQQVEGKKIPREGFLVSVRTGLNFVFKNQIILASLALDMFAVLFGGAVALLPAFAKDVLAVGPEGFGALRAAPAVGAFIMAWILAFRPPLANTGKLLLGAVAGFGICTILFALSNSFWFSLVMLAGTGFFDNISMVIRGTIIQLYTPNEMRGRVSAVNALFIGSSNELGAFESGLAAKFLGIVPSVVFGGSMTLLVVLTTWWKAPKLRDMDLHSA